MNSHTYEIIDGEYITHAFCSEPDTPLTAALRHPGLMIDVWGPHWTGYNLSLPLSVNVRRRAHRVQQLEISKKEWEAEKVASERERRDAAEASRASRRLRRWAEVTRAPTPMEDNPEPNTFEILDAWDIPPWEENINEGCADVSFEIVRTFS